MILFKRLNYKNFLSSGNQPIEIALDMSQTTLIVGTNGSGKSKKWWTEVFQLCRGEEWWWTFALDGLPKDSHKYRINQNGEQVWEMMKYGKTFDVAIELLTLKESDLKSSFLAETDVRQEDVVGVSRSW